MLKPKPILRVYHNSADPAEYPAAHCDLSKTTLDFGTGQEFEIELNSLKEERSADHLDLTTIVSHIRVIHEYPDGKLKEESHAG